MGSRAVVRCKEPQELGRDKAGLVVPLGLGSCCGWPQRSWKDFSR